MQTIWLQILLVMLGGSLLKHLFFHSLIWVLIDLATLGAAYYVLKRYPYVDIKGSMKLLGALTLVNILVDLGIIGGFVVNLLMLGLVAWMLFGSRGGNWRR